MNQASKGGARTWSTAVMLSFRLSRHVMKAAVVSEMAFPLLAPGGARPCSTVAGTCGIFRVP